VTDLAAPAPQDLDSLAHEINRRHQLADAAYRTSVEYALGVGRLLAEAKGRMPYGAWLPWLASNVSFSVRTAQRYVQLADEDARAVARRGATAARRVGDLLDLLAAGLAA
jgi:hypothetical protein